MFPRLGLTPRPSCSSAQAHLAGGSCSILCPKHCQGEMATAALLLQVQGQWSPHETKHVDLELPITSHSLWGAAAALSPQPGSCHSLRATGRSSSTSPASSLPAQGKTTSYPPPEASETTISNASLHPFIQASPQCHHFSTQCSPTTSFQETPSAKRIVQERSGQSL